MMDGMEKAKVKVSVADESSQLASLTRFVSYGLGLSPGSGLELGLYDTLVKVVSRTWKGARRNCFVGYSGPKVHVVLDVLARSAELL